MKAFSRKIMFITLLILCFQTALFSEEKKSIIGLGKEIVQLKFELFKIENRLDEYKDMSDFDIMPIEAKKEGLLRKKNQELTEAVNNNKEAAEKVLNKAAEDLKSKAEDLKEKGKDFLEYLKQSFNN